MSTKKPAPERQFHIVFEGKNIAHQHIIQICIQNGIEPKVGDSYLELTRLLQDKGVDIRAVFHDG